MNATRKRRAMTPESARRVRAEGHKAEKEFAGLIGGKIYSIAGGRKKDVTDKRGDIHSVKSGEKKWQIFLYSKQRLQRDLDFQGADLFIKCIDSFPESREEYLSHKNRYKNILKTPMRELKDFLSMANNKIIFLKKAVLNNGEVDYLTIKEKDMFHVFDGEEVIRIIDTSTRLVNSKAKRRGQMDDQKVVFKLADNHVTIGEIEMRNDSDVHYREVKFWLDRKKALDLLKNKIRSEQVKSERVIAHGKAIRKFRVA